MLSREESEHNRLQHEAEKYEMEAAEDQAVVLVARRIANATEFSWLRWSDEERPHVQWMEALFKAARDLLSKPNDLGV